MAHPSHPGRHRTPRRVKILAELGARSSADSGPHEIWSPDVTYGRP